METRIKLQEPFSYSLVPIIVIGAILLIYVIFQIVRMFYKKAKKQENSPKELTKVDIANIKKQYLLRLTDLERQYKAGNITSREAYQRTSEYIREFVYKLTNINVSTCTLFDIRNLNMPLLANLVSEYYRPEFEREFEGDIIGSIEKTKRAIEEWR